MIVLRLVLAHARRALLQARFGLTLTGPPVRVRMGYVSVGTGALSWTMGTQRSFNTVGITGELAVSHKQFNFESPCVRI